MFELRICLEAEQYEPFGKSLGETCIGFPGFVVGGMAEIRAVLSVANPDVAKALQMLTFIQDRAESTLVIGGAIATKIGQSEPVRVGGGAVQ